MKRFFLTVLLSASVGVGAAACGSKEKPKTQPKPTPVTQGQPGTTKAGDPAKPVEKAAEGDKAQPADPHANVKKADPGQKIEGPVAKVNGVPVDSKEFYAERDKITSRNAKIPPDRLKRIEANILKRLVEKELINQAIGKAGIKVEPAEVEAAFTEYKKRFQTDEQFQNYLKHGRVTVDSIKKRLEEKRALEKLIEAKGDLKVGDEEAKEFYDKNQRFYVEKGGIKASHILVKLPEKATKEQEEAAMAKIKTIQKELKGGADFAEVAKKHSEGPSAPKGGDLGFFSKGQMVKPFEEAAQKLKKDEVSGPVRTRFGYHIIKVFDKREERKKPFDEVKDQIVQSLKNKKFFQERRKLIQGLRSEAKIEKFIEEPPAPKARDRRQPGKMGAPVRPVPLDRKKLGADLKKRLETKGEAPAGDDKKAPADDKKAPADDKKGHGH